MAEWKDLPEEDKAKVISGLVLVISMLTFYFVFFHVFPLGVLPQGASPFSGMRTIMLTLYLFVVLPSALVTGGSVVCLRRRFSKIPSPAVVVRDVLLGILLIGGGYVLIVIFFLTLFDVLVPGLPIEVAIILVAPALFVPAVVIAQIMRAKKNSKYLRWAYK